MEILSGITFDPAENWRTSTKQDGNLELSKTFECSEKWWEQLPGNVILNDSRAPHIKLVFHVIPSDGVLQMGGELRLSSAPFESKNNPLMRGF